MRYLQMLMTVCNDGTSMPLSAGYVRIVNQMQQSMMRQCRLQFVEPVLHTRCNANRPVGAFLKVRFVTETVIAQTAATSVVRAFVHGLHIILFCV